MSAPDYDPDKILNRVRKLLAKAEDEAATEDEAEAYNEMASRLIAEYGIDRAMLAAKDPTSDKVSQLNITFKAPFAREKRDLLNAIARPLRCEGCYWGARRAELIGMASDLQRVELLYTSLLMQAAHAVENVHVPWDEHRAAYRRSWLRGFAGAVGERLRAAEREAMGKAQTEQTAAASGGVSVTGVPSVELVLVKRTDLVKAAFEKAHPKLKSAPKRKLSGGGGRAGYRAGQEANLHDTTALTGRKADPRAITREKHNGRESS